MPKSTPRELNSAELAESWRELEAAGEAARALAEGLSPEQLRWKPAPDRWSVAECLDHLVRTGEVYLDAFDETIEERRREGLVGGHGYRPTLVGRWLVRVLEPPPRLRVPSPAVVLPRRREEPAPDTGNGSEGGGGGDPLADFLALRPALAERLQAADGLDLRRVRMSSPFFALIRFDLGSAFRIVAAHERRHLWQARRVTEAEGFPGG